MNEDAEAGATAGPGLSPGANAADASFDLSLRLLTALVMFALIGSVSLLAYRWIDQNRGDSGTAVARKVNAVPPPVARTHEQGPLHRDEVLMDPGRVFKCEDQGRVTFSDQACVSAAPATRTPGAATAPATTP